MTAADLAVHADALRRAGDRTGREWSMTRATGSIDTSGTVGLLILDRTHLVGTYTEMVFLRAFCWNPRGEPLGRVAPLPLAEAWNGGPLDPHRLLRNPGINNDPLVNAMKLADARQIIGELPDLVGCQLSQSSARPAISFGGNEVSVANHNVYLGDVLARGPEVSSAAAAAMQAQLADDGVFRAIVIREDSVTVEEVP